MPVDFSTLVQQNPANVGGLLAPHGFFVPARMHITATGGIVGTAYGLPNTAPVPASGAPGFPGMGVTCLPNGIYDVIHPPTRFAQIYPQLQTSSGVSVDVTVVRDKTNPYSGIARLAMINGSGAAAILPSGSIVDMLFFVSPSSTPNITPF